MRIRNSGISRMLAVCCSGLGCYHFGQAIVAGVTAEEAAYNPVHDTVYLNYVRALNLSEQHHLRLCDTFLGAAVVLSTLAFWFMRSRIRNGAPIPWKRRVLVIGLPVVVAAFAGLVLGVVKD